MTRDEFYEEITTFWQLKDFCEENNCEQFVEDIYDEETRDEYINECLVDWARNDTWTELYSRLDDIPTGYDYYRNDGYGEWEGLTDTDLSSIMDDVADWCDENDIWDEDEEEEPEEDDEELAPEEDIDEEDAIPLEEEDCSLSELFFAGVSCVSRIAQEESEQEAEAEKEFDVLFAAG